MLLVSADPGLSVCRQRKLTYLSAAQTVSAQGDVCSITRGNYRINQLTKIVFAPNYVVDEDKAKITDSNGTLKTFTATAQSGNKVEVHKFSSWIR